MDKINIPKIDKVELDKIHSTFDAYCLESGFYPGDICAWHDHQLKLREELKTVPSK